MLFFIIKEIPYNLRNGFNRNLTLEQNAHFGANSVHFKFLVL